MPERLIGPGSTGRPAEAVVRPCTHAVTQAVAGWIALLLPGGVFKVFRGFGQQETPATHPRVFCGLDQKILKDTPRASFTAFLQ